MVAKSESRDAAATPERTRLGGAETVLVSGAFVAFAGVPGIIAAILIVAAWYLASSTYAFALGQIALVALLSGADFVQVAVVEAGLLGVLLAPIIAHDNPVDSILITLGGVLFGSTLAWTSSDSLLGFLSTATVTGLPTASFLLVATFVIVTYVLYRYHLVTLEPESDNRVQGGGG